MGQRSEIYVIYEDCSKNMNLVGRYFGWSYAERMISRVAFTAKWLQQRLKYGVVDESLISIIETNFDTIDHQRTDDLIGNSHTFTLNPDPCLDDGKVCRK